MIDEKDIEWMRAKDEELLGTARDSILQVIRNHEERTHGGGCCLEERINALAFMAHSLGIIASADDSWEYVRAVLKGVYEARDCLH